MLMTLLVTFVAVMFSVLVHYEAFLRLSVLMKHMHILPRFRIVFGAVGALIAHVIEIWIFAIGYFFLVQTRGNGSLVGEFSGAIGDFVYYSFATYTSLGFGDIIPFGDLRFLTGMEALTGLVLIAWTASFMFVQMQKLWKDA